MRFPDPRLRQSNHPVKEIDARVRRLVDEMMETMYAAAGAGLAAIQVGDPERIFIVDAGVAGRDKNEAPLVFKLGLDVDAAAKLLPTCSGSSDVFRQSAISPDPFRPKGHLYRGVHQPGGTGKQIEQIRQVFAQRGVDIEAMFPFTHLLVEESMKRGFTYGTVEDPPSDTVQ